jgi:enamine deaminase RidA (YjgF/YER057c/UK114 family)
MILLAIFYKKERKNMIFRNPDTIHKPLASYSHQAEVSGNAKWLVMSGQLGIDKQGNVPENVINQLELAMDNVLLNLEAAGMSKENLVKLIIYFVGPVDATQRRSVTASKLGEHQPCITVLYISGLATEAFKVEIDAWACKE